MTWTLATIAILGAMQSAEFKLPDLLAHLESLQRDEVVVRWRTSQQLPGMAKATTFEDSYVRAFESVSVGSGVAYNRTENGRGDDKTLAISERFWSDGTLQINEPDVTRRMVAFTSGAFEWQSAYNLVDTAIPGLLIKNPSAPNAIITALRGGRIHSHRQTGDVFECVFFTVDPDIDRWTIRVETTPAPKILSVTCEQAATPSDRPFDERVLVKTVTTVTEWKSIDGTLVPSRADKEFTLNYAITPPEKRPDSAKDTPVQTCTGGFELVELSALPSGELDTLAAAMRPSKGDLVNDRRLGLKYQMGGSMIYQGESRFQLNAGETIEEPLDEDIISRLASLEILQRPVRPAVQEATEDRWAGWTTLAAGLSILGAGVVWMIVLKYRKRRAA